MDYLKPVVDELWVWLPALTRPCWGLEIMIGTKVKSAQHCLLSRLLANMRRSIPG